MREFRVGEEVEISIRVDHQVSVARARIYQLGSRWAVLRLNGRLVQSYLTEIRPAAIDCPATLKKALDTGLI